MPQILGPFPVTVRFIHTRRHFLILKRKVVTYEQTLINQHGYVPPIPEGCAVEFEYADGGKEYFPEEERHTWES